MSEMDIIKKRKSVRTFGDEPLRKEDADRIMEFAATVSTPYDLPIIWTFLDQDGLSSAVIAGKHAFIAGKMKKAPHAEEAFGYAFEKIVLFAESLGVGTTWIAGTMDRKAFEKAVSLEDDEVMPCVSPLGYPAEKMSLREIMMRKGVKANSRLPFSGLFYDGSFDHPLTEEAAGSLQTALEAVRLAPSAVNWQPWRIVVSGDRVHFYVKHGRIRIEKEWDIQKIDLGIALCHFELVAKECGLAAEFAIEDPGIGTETDTEYIASYIIG